MKKLFKKSLAVIMVVVMTLTAAPLGGFVGLELPSLFDFKAEAATYSASKAAQYALTYWENYNPNYSNYNSIGGDCANFVSQCLYAGGLPMDDDWYWYSYSNKSASWTGALSIKKYLVDNLGYELIMYPSASQIEVGDVLWYGEGSHVGICSEVINGVPWVCAHNYDRHTSNWKLGFSSYGVIKMNGVTSHVHNYNAEGYEQLHPHKVFRKCSCGDWYYTGETKKLSTCTTCYPTVQHNTKIQAWISSSKMGSVPNKFTVGSQYYLCFKLYDDNTGDLYNTYSSSSYTAKMTIKNPDGKVANTYSYKNSDYNWIGYTVDDVGTYTGKIEISGDIEGSVDVSFYVQSNGTVTLTPATLNLNLATQKTGVVEYGLSSYG